jgi:hypothetical protein
MNYLNPVEYSKKVKALMEDESAPVEEVIPVKGEKTMKERLSELSPDEATKLQEYIASIKEIKKAIQELINKDGIEEAGGNMSSGLYLPEEE